MCSRYLLPKLVLIPFEKSQHFAWQWQMLKAPSLIPLTYIFSVLWCNCWTYDVNLGHIFQNPILATLGVYNIFDNKFDQNWPEEISFIWWIRWHICHGTIAYMNVGTSLRPLSTFLLILELFWTYFRTY